MSYDPVENFGYSSIISGGVIGSTTGTTIQVQSGTGSLFQFPQNITVWPPGVQPTKVNAEIMRITNIVLDTLTVIRGQEGSTVQSNITANYQVANTMTAFDLTQVQNDGFNAYKFLVYRANSWSTGNNTPAAVPFDTKLYDTGSNVDIVTHIGRFTAPVAGFYQFSTAVLISGAATRIVVEIAKNGSEYLRFWDTGTVSGAAGQLGGSALIQLAVGDFIEVYEYTPQVDAGGFGTGPLQTWFSGFLVSLT